MAEDLLPPDDDELRRMIRAEIEQRDQQLRQQNLQREAARVADADAERRRRIYQEELRRYYQDKPGFRQIVREDGEVDWVLEADLRHGERLFDEVLEDPDDAKKRLRLVVAFVAIFLAALSVLLYLFLAEKGATVQIVSNVSGAQVVLDAAPLNYFTNATLKEIPAGEHVITIQKEGYAVVGEPIQRIFLRGGKEITLTFELQPKSEPAQPTRGKE